MSLAELLDVRAKGLEQERNTPPVRCAHRDYAKYFKWLEEGKFTLGELSTQLLHAGLDNRALEMDPSKPYGWKPSDDEEKRPAWRRRPSRAEQARLEGRLRDVRRGHRAALRPQAATRGRAGLHTGRAHRSPSAQGSMDVKKLGGCLHKLGVKYDRPLFELATKAFDEDQSGLIEFDEFVEMFATLRASDELALGDFGAPSAELTAQELSDVKASFDAIDADGSGAIDEGEVKALFEKVGLDATDKEIRGLVSFLDADGSGEVELGEFNELMMCAKARRKAPDAPLDADGALKSLFEEQRKAAKVVRVAVGAALAALHRARRPSTASGRWPPTARCLVGHCGEPRPSCRSSATPPRKRSAPPTRWRRPNSC